MNLFRFVLLLLATATVSLAQESTRVEIESDGWKLIGDLLTPSSARPVPAVLMLNQAAGTRKPYAKLATDLASRGMASLRLDLRGHGESVNLGRFVPGQETERFIYGADPDVIAALRYLESLKTVDANRIAVIGGSYSGEEMADAARKTKYAQAYVALSPGSFSDESIRSIDSTGIPWLFIVSKNERYLKEITAAVQEMSQSVELLIIPGTMHATNILESRPDIAERIAVWLKAKLVP